MWRSFDAAVVRAELDVLARHGLGVTRSFLFWPHAMPVADRLDDAVMADFSVFLDLHVEVGMVTVPTFLVGHMSGRNWDPPWRGERDLYTDAWLLDRQSWYVREVVRRLHRHPAVTAWLITNEMPNYAAPADHRAVAAWAARMVDAARAGGATQPVSLGDGARGLDVTGVDDGFRLPEIAPLVDWIGPHAYPMGDDVARQHLAAAFNCELAHAGRPVVLEEFGVTDAFTAPDHAADYYRQVLHTSLLAGARGWLAWSNTDFDLVTEEPYRHHSYELRFGVTDTRGRPKPTLGELAAFGSVLDRVEVDRCRRAETQTALLVTDYLGRDEPFTEPTDRPVIRDVLHQTYVAARAADLAPAVVRERDGVPAARLLLLPCGRQLAAPSWEALEVQAAAGTTVYLSYFAGASGFQRGPWHHFFGAFCGVEPRLRYGLVDPVTASEARWRLVEDLGDLEAGTELTFRVAGNEHGRARLPLRPTEAAVLAVDAQGEPALLRRRVGAGAVVLSAYPVEYFAACTARANPEDTWRLYRALAVETGTLGPVTVARPDVWVDGLVRDDGARFVWFVSASPEPLTVTPALPAGARLVDLDVGAPAEVVALEPYGVAVLRLLDTGTE